MLIISSLFIVCGHVFLCVDAIGIHHLSGDADYRKVSLHWEAYLRNGRMFPSLEVRYCELQSWGNQRCKVQSVDENVSNELYTDNILTRVYRTDVDGLRMATTYSFEIRPTTDRRENRADDDDNIIIIPTKGFSARATQCLPHASEVEVSTGPYFAGRITVEASDGDRCTIDGDPDSPRDTYILQINHKECGSQINETTVATYVIVQENLPILTHSTRRFLVLCTYQPDTLTVRAGLSLPSGEGHGQSAVVPTDEHYNSVRRSRHLRPAKLKVLETQAEFPKQENMTAFLIMLIFTIGGICSIIVLTFRCKRKKNDFSENEAIAAETSSTADIEDCVQTENVSTNYPESLSNNSIEFETDKVHLNQGISI